MLNVAQDLQDQICQIIGSPEYRAFLNGRELNLRNEPSKTLGGFGFVSPTAQLMVQKRPMESDQGGKQAAKGPLNSIEAEILKHFEELYEMLDSREPQGSMVMLCPLGSC